LTASDQRKQRTLSLKQPSKGARELPSGGRRNRTLKFGCAFLLALATASIATSKGRPRVRHFAANANFDASGVYAPASVGFNLADVSSRRELDLLPDGVAGLMWVGLCRGVTAQFKALVGAVIDHPKVFGFYLIDDPDPTGIWRRQCKASDLRAEADWIHQRRPNAITFVALMNLGSSASPRFSADYRPETTHIDLFGVSPYPCRTNLPACDYDMIDRFVRAAREASVPIDSVVPTFQSFGGGEWRTDSGGGYRLPSPDEMQSMFERWKTLTPKPVFDYAYSWGMQRSDNSLVTSPDLQAAFARHNLARSAAQ
jgi:hypothetical protein